MSAIIAWEAQNQHPASYQQQIHSPPQLAELEKGTVLCCLQPVCVTKQNL